MLKQKMLNVALFVIGGITLGGCAANRSWSPALEDAQNTYAQISQDPIVASLAAVELQAARTQLTTAETAANEFRKPHTIEHEAKLAKIKTLIAQQRARALSANHSLQVALGQQTLLPEEQVLAATIIETPDEPILAAAHPSDGVQSDIASQIAALHEQLAMLQAQIDLNQPKEIPTSQGSLAEPEMISPIAPAGSEEPKLGAAMSAEKPAMIKPAAASTSQIQQQLAAINAKPTPAGMSLTLGERYFNQGTAKLWNSRVARHLDNVASILDDNPELILDIEAHTDDVEDSNANYDLSVGRAISIKTALILRGIDKSRISAEGFGHSLPIAENTDLLGRLQNRRVELIFPNAPL